VNVRIAAVLTASAGLWLAGCGGEAGEGGVVVDTIGGVPSVMNTDRGVLGDTLPWKLTQTLLVTGDQLYDRKATVYALDVGILPNGNVLVLDTGHRRVLRFGPGGAYLGSFGGPGQDPGQFVTPLFLEVGGDRIYVLDSGLNRVTEFDSAGIFLDRFEVDLQGLAGTTPLFESGGRDQIYVAAEPVPFLESARDTGYAVLLRLDMTGTIVDTLATFMPSTWNHIERSDGRSSYVKPRLAPEPRLSASSGAVAMSMGARYLIEMRRPDGSLLLRVARQYENVAVTPEIRDSVLDRMVQGPGSLPREALELVSFAPVVPAIDGLVLDDQGRLWVDVYSNEVTRRDVFDAEGRFLGALYLPQPVELMDVRGDRACGLISEIDGRSAVVCYRVQVAAD
jgi:hypothetical protein